MAATPAVPDTAMTTLAGLPARRRQMTVVDAILLAISVAVFGYLGIAMFKPEWVLGRPA